MNILLEAFKKLNEEENKVTTSDLITVKVPDEFFNKLVDYIGDIDVDIDGYNVSISVDLEDLRTDFFDEEGDPEEIKFLDTLIQGGVYAITLNAYIDDFEWETDDYPTGGHGDYITYATATYPVINKISYDADLYFNPLQPKKNIKIDYKEKDIENIMSSIVDDYSEQIFSNDD